MRVMDAPLSGIVTSIIAGDNIAISVDLTGECYDHWSWQILPTCSR